jgi:cell division protein FtsB
MADAQQDQKPAGTVDELQSELIELRAENQRLTRDIARLKQELNRAQFGARRR